MHIMQWRSKRSLKERTMTMNSSKLLSKTMLFGSIGLAMMLFGWTPSCRAQESSPAHFTDTGVEDAYPASKPLPKKTPKAQIATNPVAVTSDKAIARKQKAHKTARKQSEVYASGL